MIELREYQRPILLNNEAGIVVLHWARQIGKSHTLAQWAVSRCLFNPGRLVTVLSNSRENGAEFVRKCAEFCRGMEHEFEVLPDGQGGEGNSSEGHLSPALSPKGGEGEGLVRRTVRGFTKRHFPSGVRTESFRMEVRVLVEGKVGRIKVLAANPRTARGFSGDLILDEFAFHEDSAAIWEAVEPILASNPDFKCRIASTGNGKHNMFYRMVQGVRNSECGVRNEDGGGAVGTVESGEAPKGAGNSGAEAHALQTLARPVEHVDKSISRTLSATILSRLQAGAPNDRGEFYVSAAGFVVSRVTRTAAYEMGVKIFDLKGKRKDITPEAARSRAMDKRAYDQNYECAFADENMTLLTHGLISAAQSEAVTIDAQEWSQASLERMSAAAGRLEVGNDIGRNRDLSMVTVIEREGQLRRVVGMLRMENMRLPEQQRQVALVCRLPRFHAYCGDMTGLGLGLVEYLQEEFGRYRIRGVNFSSTEPVSDRLKLEGRKQETARVTEIMAVNLLACFEDRSLKDLPNDAALVEDLRKPEKITSPGGRVSIAATRDEAGHADGFWSLALAVRAGEQSGGEFGYEAIRLRDRFWRLSL